MNEVLVYFALKYKGQFDAIYKALSQKEIVDEALKQELKSKCHSSYVTIIDEDYPDCLRQISCPPFVLFYYGNLSLLKTPCISVIGQRRCTQYGKDVTRSFVYELVDKGYTIVSGMALGIDGIAHQSAIKAHGHTIAVLGGGIDYPYPKTNADIYYEMVKHHLVISEYPFDDVPRRDGFPKRNRIIAGLSQGLLVCEAQQRSGSMITVGFAVESGREVFAVPSRIDDPSGCNMLIQQGAKLVISVDDLLEELNCG